MDVVDFMDVMDNKKKGHRPLGAVTELVPWILLR